DRRAVRPRPAGPAPGPQDRAECALLGGVRCAPGRTVALWLARVDRRALDIGGDGAAGAGVLRIEVRAGGGAGGEVRREQGTGNERARRRYVARLRFPGNSPGPATATPPRPPVPGSRSSLLPCSRSTL